MLPIIRSPTLQCTVWAPIWQTESIKAALGPDELRTAPLWGLGQRLFFLHDGCTFDLLGAIEEHESSGDSCLSTPNYEQFVVNDTQFTPSSRSEVCGSESNTVIDQLNQRSGSQKQDILIFLRSL
jgi:hypothetical protein